MESNSNFGSCIQQSDSQSILLNDNVIKSLNNLIPSIDPETISTAKFILKVLKLRDKWVMKYPIIDSPNIRIDSKNKSPIYDPLNVSIPEYLPGSINYKAGLCWFSDSTTIDTWPNVLLSDEYKNDLSMVMSLILNKSANSFTNDRLKLLDYKYTLHKTLNHNAEFNELRLIKYRDFYNLTRVDTHIHTASAILQDELLVFIRDKFNSEPDTIVDIKDGNNITLKELFDNLNINPNEASIDLLGINDLGDCFRNFDKFNDKYSPFGIYDLRTIFLKVDNHINGRYFGEICKRVIQRLESTKHEYAEWRISIYGKSEDEWQKLALWVKNNNLQSNHIRWVIQIPRLYPMLKARNAINSVGDMLRNIFKPVFEAIQDPQKHPEIYLLFHQIIAWDCVDDESDGYNVDSNMPDPDNWTSDDAPPFTYFHYYLYANVRMLNKLLIKQNIAPKLFRPHCGECGSISHLASMFLLANTITHGLVLDSSPVALYLYYLKQIGLAVSPLGMNKVYMSIVDLPYYKFYRLGINMSLSTDNPLMFHLMKPPLLEEYASFAHINSLDPVDMAELARNSVIQCGFEHEFKKLWLGPNYLKEGIESNSPEYTNTSNIRVKYRYDNLMCEFNILKYLESRN